MKNKFVKSTRVPVYRDSGFAMDSPEEMRQAFLSETEHKREPDSYIYSRYRNPTVVAAEEEIMKTEGCEWALLTQSGMSAIDTAVSLFQKGSNTRPWLFFTEIYGGTISYIDSVLLRRRGIKAEWFAPVDGRYNISSLEVKLRTLEPEFVYFETISNPMLIVADGPAIISRCKKMGIKTIVDNTFATPYLWKPLESGADLVIHSATKYFSGHGNLTAGVICGNDKELLQEAVAYRKLVGHMISPDDAYRLQSQIQTFGLRFPRQCENALMSAEYLASNPLIKSVWYPGMASHVTHSEALKLFGAKGSGAMVTFTFDGDSTEIKRKRRDDFIERVSHRIRLVPTLGDPHTILMPVEPVWGHKYPDAGMIRLSVGFEPLDELIDTLGRALTNMR
ncbi:MAG: PLP-dependent transferase [Bacteroidales bacterium]|nr:PLP-dependent transferase [Bacteroidales bacterium]